MTTCGTTLCDLVGQTGYAILAGTGLGFWVGLAGAAAAWVILTLRRG